MKTKVKIMSMTAVTVIGCAAGICHATLGNTEKQSALTLMCVEALASSETVLDCDYYCKEDRNYACTLHYNWGVTYCVNKSKRQGK